jgi:hypothetical protein
MEIMTEEVDYISLLKCMLISVTPKHVSVNMQLVEHFPNKAYILSSLNVYRVKEDLANKYHIVTRLWAG